jgi:hypothetical protein
MAEKLLPVSTNGQDMSDPNFYCLMDSKNLGYFYFIFNKGLFKHVFSISWIIRVANAYVYLKLNVEGTLYPRTN